MGSNKSIIVPIDFGDQSMIALKQSFNLAKLTNSSLILVNVIDSVILNSFTDIMSKDEKFEEQLKSDSLKKLNELADNVRKETGLKVTCLIRMGKVYEELVELADEVNPTCIVMGTQGPIGLKKKFLGSMFKVTRCH